MLYFISIRISNLVEIILEFHFHLMWKPPRLRPGLRPHEHHYPIIFDQYWLTSLWRIFREVLKSQFIQKGCDFVISMINFWEKWKLSSVRYLWKVLDKQPEVVWRSNFHQNSIQRMSKLYKKIERVSMGFRVVFRENKKKAFMCSNAHIRKSDKGVVLWWLLRIG